MKKCALRILFLGLLLSIPSYLNAQTYYPWMSRTGGACSSVADGTDHSLCLDSTKSSLYKCATAGGACTTPVNGYQWTGGASSVTTAVNVGVGTLSPKMQLHIYNATGDNQLLVDEPGYTSLSINSAGTVGIGTSQPDISVFLDVEGPAKFIDGAGGAFTVGNAVVPNEVLLGVTSAPDGLNTIMNGSNNFIGIGTTGNNRGKGGGALVIMSNVGIGTFETRAGVLSIMSGNVGIGTWIPNAPLTLKGGSGSIPALIVNSQGNSWSEGMMINPSSANNYSNIVFTNTANTNANAWGIGRDSANYLYITNQGLGGSYQLNISPSSGNIGIGQISAATNKLDVHGTMAVGTTYAGTNTAPTDGLIVQGNVGIGTPTTIQALSIVGSINTSGNTGNSYLNSTGGNVGIGSTNPLALLDLGTSGTIRVNNTSGVGWTTKSAVNQACNTTCGSSSCGLAFDQGTLGVVLPSIVECTDATADQCRCLGP